MNGQLILKEWKEKIEFPLFFLALLIVIVGLLAAVPQRGEGLLLLAGSVVLVFLPGLGLLIGATAFSAEFKDGAWEFLFSRPVRKSTVWISKLIALCGYLAATLLVYYLVLSALPGVRARLSEFALDSDLGRITPWMLCLVLSFSLFIIAFSLSLLTDKLFQVVFLSGFLCLGLFALSSFLFFVPARIQSRFVFLVPVIWGLAVAGIAAASLAVFCREDFSQPRRKTLGFLKWSALLLIPALLCVLAAAWIGEWFRPLQYIDVQPAGRFAFVQTDRGSYLYDTDRDKLMRLAGRSWEWGLSAGGGKIVMLREVSKGDGLESRLWIMDEDGRNMKRLLSAQQFADPRFKKQDISDCDISRDGARVAFITYPLNHWRRGHLWTVNSDGTDLRDYPIDFPNAGLWAINGWTGDDRRLLLSFMEIAPEGERKIPSRWLVIFSAETGAWQIVTENFSMFYSFGLSPAGDKLGAGFHSPQLVPPGSSKPFEVYVTPDILAVFDLATLSRTDILTGRSFHAARWDPTETRIAFLTDQGKNLGVYSLAESRVTAEREVGSETKNLPRNMMDWADGGRKIAVTSRFDDHYVLRIFNGDLGSEKNYRIPGSTKFPTHPTAFGLGTKILIEEFQKNRLLVFDLATEKWRKLF